MYSIRPQNRTTVGFREIELCSDSILEFGVIRQTESSNKDIFISIYIKVDGSLKEVFTEELDGERSEWEQYSIDMSNYSETTVDILFILETNSNINDNGSVVVGNPTVCHGDR